MKISSNWLKKYIALTESPEQIAAILTSGGLEVEKTELWESVKGSLNGLVIGQVLTCEKHPGADKLKKTTVDVGNNTVLPIVCGAANVTAGLKVIVATVGATLYPAGGESFKINKAKIRGEVSEGMICAEDEIGMGHSHEGILVLETDLPTGTAASAYFNLQSDTVFEIGLTPNRSDAASHLGVARDLKALLHRELVFTKGEVIRPDRIEQPVKVVVENAKDCPRYAGLTIRNVKVQESPVWLQEALKSIGLSSINNIVDITNYILHDLGQPLHAFDVDKIAGNQIIVKTVAENTKFTTLDGIERSLKSTDLMICDAEKPMCFAGILGGKNSGVSVDTKHVFIESAYFSPAVVRKTALGHGLKTEASFRFERGTDPNMPVIALMKAANLIKELAGGEIASELLDIYPQAIANFELQVSISRINRLIGKEIGRERIIEILTDLSVVVEEISEDLLKLSIPPYKVDVQREADVVEEILRVYGYNNIELSARVSTAYIAPSPEKDKDKIQKIISGLLVPQGFFEIITNSLNRSQYAELLGTSESSVKIINALSESLDTMRQSLLFSGLEVLLHNINRQQKDLKVVEFGKVYNKAGSTYAEENRLGLLMTGAQHAETWSDKANPADFYTLKSQVFAILSKLGLHQFKTESVTSSLFENGLSCSFKGKEIVSFGKLSQQLLKAMDLRQPVYYADFSMDVLLELYKHQLVFEEVPRFPEVRRDLSLILDKKVNFSEIQSIALQIERKLIRDINVFDIYEGDKIEAGKKSYSVSFILQDLEQTLTDKVIDLTMKKLIDSFENKLGAIIRK